MDVVAPACETCAAPPPTEVETMKHVIRQGDYYGGDLTAEHVHEHGYTTAIEFTAFVAGSCRILLDAEERRKLIAALQAIDEEDR